MCPERSRKQFSSLCRSREARESLFKSQEKSIKQFSALCRCCEARASLFYKPGNIWKAVFTAVEVL